MTKDINERIEAIRNESGKHCPCCHSTENWSQYNEAEARDLLFDFARRTVAWGVNQGAGGKTATEIISSLTPEQIARWHHTQDARKP